LTRKSELLDQLIDPERQIRQLLEIEKRTNNALTIDIPLRKM